MPLKVVGVPLLRESEATTGGVLSKKVFLKIHGKTPVP